MTYLTRLSRLNTLRILLLSMLLMCPTFTAAGCQAPPTGTSGGPTYTLDLFRRTTNRQITRFRIDAAGQLEYAGGRSASTNQLKAVATLDNETLARIQQIVADEHLVDVKGHFLPSYEHTLYRFQYAAGSQSAQYETVDDEGKGLERLHDQLFALQKRYRYPEATGDGNSD